MSKYIQMKAEFQQKSIYLSLIKCIDKIQISFYHTGAHHCKIISSLAKHFLKISAVINY